jgi:hypothetical protein
MHLNRISKPPLRSGLKTVRSTLAKNDEKPPDDNTIRRKTAFDESVADRLQSWP